MEIHCDLSNRELFRVPERLACLGGRCCEICGHHLLPSLSEVHFHPCCSTPCPICCVAACVSEFQCWHLVVVAFSTTGGQLGSLCTVLQVWVILDLLLFSYNDFINLIGISFVFRKFLKYCITELIPLSFWCKGDVRVNCN